jgi:hypothetical protein
MASKATRPKPLAGNCAQSGSVAGPKSIGGGMNMTTAGTPNAIGMIEITTMTAITTEQGSEKFEYPDGWPPSAHDQTWSRPVRHDQPKQARLHFLITYLIHPGTALCLGCKSNLENLDPSGISMRTGLVRNSLINNG